jgi:hypothetical protein
MIVIAKSLETYVPKELMPLPKGSSLFFKEINFSLGNNHVPKEKEFKLPQGII